MAISLGEDDAEVFLCSMETTNSTLLESNRLRIYGRWEDVTFLTKLSVEPKISENFLGESLLLLSVTEHDAK
jgi:hypothetical protein